MKDQQELNLETRAMSKSDGPASSHRAAENMAKSGTLAKQHRLAIEAVQRLPGRSSKVLAAYVMTGLDRYAMARRLPELEKMGLVWREIVPKEDTIWWPSAREKGESGETKKT